MPLGQDTVYTALEFERESRYLEQLIWEAIVLQPRMKVLFCGYGPDGRQVERAVAAGAKVSVIEHRNEEINRFSVLDAKLIRGSTSVIPARDGSFDLAVSFHYLHEVDPFFHSQVLFELSRVAKRIALVEPAPPADPLGKRIALLYSQAKRELGQFEYYQPLEYWKKLLQGVKADVSQHVFAFAKVPPREYLLDTIDLLLDTMEIEEAPRAYIDELRQIAKRSDVQILPPPRYVLVGAAAGELVTPSFTARETPAPVVAKPAAVQPVTSAPAAITPPAAQPRISAAEQTPAITAEAGYAFPPVEPMAQPAFTPAPPPVAPAAAPASAWQPNFGGDGFGFGNETPPLVPEAGPAFSPGLPFGLPDAPESGASPFGAPFAMPGMEPADAFGVPPDGASPITTWQWEPPEDPNAS